MTLHLLSASIDVDWTALGKAGYVSAIAGLLVLAVAGLGVVSSLKAQDGKAQTGGASAVGAYGVITIACVVALFAIAGYGIYLLTQ
jgi:hypothetical protein